MANDVEEVETMWLALERAVEELAEDEEQLDCLLQWMHAQDALETGFTTDVLCPSCGKQFLVQCDELLQCQCSFALHLTPECPDPTSLKAHLEAAVDEHRATGCMRAPFFRCSNTEGPTAVLFASCNACSFCSVVL